MAYVFLSCLICSLLLLFQLVWLIDLVISINLHLSKKLRLLNPLLTDCFPPTYDLGLYKHRLSVICIFCFS